MNDPRKDLGRQNAVPKKPRFTPDRLTKICELLESDFSTLPIVDSAAKQVAKSIRKNETPEREDLASVLLDLLYRKTITVERRQKERAEALKKKEAKPSEKPRKPKKRPSGPTPLPKRTGFSKEIEKSDHGTKKRRPRKNLKTRGERKK